MNLEFEAGFLNVSPEPSEEFKVEELVKDYEHLRWLFCTNLDENFQEVKTFVKIMLELKHSAIVREFCCLYNWLVHEIKGVVFEAVEKEQPRFQWLEEARDRVVGMMVEEKEQFVLLLRYLQEDEKETKKLILVELYCLLAEKFNFNINEFYSEAFTVPNEQKSCKKAKKSC